MSNEQDNRYPFDRRADCFVCKRQPRIVHGCLGPHIDKAGHICPGSGEVVA